ncbi:MAG: hypothetical protein WCZ66_06450 [Sphingomonadaceae bacterium]
MASADALIGQLLAESAEAGMRPFERTTRIEEPGEQPVVRVDRFDPQAAEDERWSLISINGQPPDDKQRKSHRKDMEKQPVPGFYRLHLLLAGEPQIRRENGQTIYHWPRLQKGALGMKGPDISARLAADVFVTEVNGRPTITRLRIHAPEPFSVMAVAKFRSFDAISTYRPDASGAPVMVSQTTTTDTNIPFRASGVTRTEAHFRHY